MNEMTKEKLMIMGIIVLAGAMTSAFMAVWSVLIGKGKGGV